MSTFLPNISDNIPEISQYSPNISFFDQQLEKKANQYQKGYNQVSEAYNSILNAPLTDEANVQTRETYLKEAQDKLKNLSSVDLSQQSNVDQANNVFAPFWQDQYLLKDAAFTQSIQTEMNKGMMLRDSKDKDQRDQYSETSMQYLANGLDKLKNAGRSDSVYNNLEKRRYVPAVDEAQVFNKALKDQGFKVEWDEQRGMQMIHHVNGQATQQSFAQFALANQTPEMRDYHRIQGVVEKEQSIKNVKAAHPGITDDQALNIVANGMITDYRNQYGKVVDDLKVTKSSNDKQIAEYEAKAAKAGGLTPLEKAQYDQLKDYSGQLDGQITEKTQEYNNVSSPDNKDVKYLKDQIVRNPDQYYGNLANTRAINSWANAASRNETREVKINPIFQEKAKEDYENAGLKIQEGHLLIDQQQLGIAKQNANTEFYKAQIEAEKAGLKLNADGTIVGGNGDLTSQNGVHVIGSGTTNITQLGNAADMFQQRQAEKYNDSNEKILSVPGLGRTIVGIDGGKGAVSEADVVSYFSAAKRQFTNNTTVLTSDERLAKQKVDAALSTKTGITINSPETLRQATIVYGKQYFGDKMKNGGVGLTPEDQQSYFLYKTAIDERTQALTYDRIKSDLLKKELTQTTDPNIKKLVVTRQDGSKDFVNANDISKTIPDVILTDTKGNNIKVSAKQIGASFLNNTFNSHILSAPNANGGTVYGYNTVIGDKDLNIDSNSYYKIQSIAKHLVDSYGDPRQFSKLKKDLDTRVVPNIGEFSSKTGAYGIVTNFDIDDPKSKDGSSLGTKLTQEIANPANQAGPIFIDGKASTDKDVNASIQLLSGMGNSDLKKYVSNIQHISIGPTGTPSIKIQFSPETSTNKTQIGSTNLKDLANKTIEIPISPTSSGSTINAIPRNSGHYIYQSLLDGKTLKSDPMFDAAGFNYTIQPDNTNNPRQVYVTINRSIFDPKSGKYVKQPPNKTTFDLYGPNAKTPDEIESGVSGLFSTHIQQNIQNQAQVTNNAAQLNQLIPIK